MNIIVIKEKLKEGLDAVLKISGQHENLPIIKNVLVKCQQNKISLCTTNLEMGIEYVISGKVIETGETTIPVQLFSQMITNLPHDRINLEEKENNINITTDNYSATIQGLPAEEFPIIPTVKDTTSFIKTDTATFHRGLEQVVSATQFSDLRPELNSVLLSLSGGILVLAATDSFRLAQKTIDESQFTAHDIEDFQALIPLKTVHELLRITKPDGELRIYCEENQILFKTDKFDLLSRLTEGNFPNYQEIIPTEFDVEVVVGRDEFIDAVKLSSVLSGSVNEISIGIDKSKKTIRIRSGGGSEGENTYSLSAKVQKADDTLPSEVSFNWKYLLDGLRALEGNEVFVGVNTDNRPGILRSPQKSQSSYFYVLMPILKG